jgi:hypothetical protein
MFEVLNVYEGLWRIEIGKSFMEALEIEIFKFIVTF